MTRMRAPLLAALAAVLLLLAAECGRKAKPEPRSAAPLPPVGRHYATR